MTSLGLSPEADATGGGDWAICCSGGGIRSAAYCLGALQSLDRGGLLGEGQVDPGGVRGQLHRLLPCAGGARPAAGTVPPRLRPRDRRRSGTCVTTPATSRPTARRCWSASCRCCSGRWSRSSSWRRPAVRARRTPGAGCCAGRACWSRPGRARLTAAVTGLGWWLPPVIAAGVTLALFAFWWLTLEPAGRAAGGRARLVGVAEAG